MWPLLVVFCDPILREFLQLFQLLEHEHVQDFGPIGPAESLNKSILHWAAWFDELQPDAMLLCPVSQPERGFQ